MAIAILALQSSLRPSYPWFFCCPKQPQPLCSWWLFLCLKLSVATEHQNSALLSWLHGELLHGGHHLTQEIDSIWKLFCSAPRQRGRSLLFVHYWDVLYFQAVQLWISQTKHHVLCTGYRSRAIETAIESEIVNFKG